VLSAYILFPLMAGLAGVATPLVRLLLTDKWLPCVPYMQIYCFTLAFYPVHSCNLQAINAMGRSDIFLKLEIWKKGIGILALVIAVFCFESPIAIAMTGAFTTIISCFINASPNKKLIGYSYLEQMKDILPSFAAAVVMLAAVLAIFNKRVLGDFVRACARDGATSPEKARTLAELGFLKNSSVRSALKRRGSLRRVVRCVEDDLADLAAGVPMREEIAALYPEAKADGEAGKPSRTDLNTARFYIPEAEIYTAEIRYDKKGTNWLSFIGTLVLGLVVVLLLIQLMPDILQLVDNFISMVNPSKFVQ
jgi:hypothetical protein